MMAYQQLGRLQKAKSPSAPQIEKEPNYSASNSFSSEKYKIVTE